MEETQAPSGIDYGQFGRNTRGLRSLQHLTQTELAKRAGVTLTTVYTVEKGIKVRTKTLQKIASGLSTTFEALASRNTIVKNRTLPYVIHRREETMWLSELDLRKNVPDDNHKRIQDPAERLRLGRNGAVMDFATLPNFVMANGPGLTFIELYGVRESTLNAGVYKDCVLFSIRGDALITIAGEQVLLREGEVMGFAALDLEEMRPASPIGPKDMPVSILWIGADRIGKIPGERHRQR